MPFFHAHFSSLFIDLLYSQCALASKESIGVDFFGVSLAFACHFFYFFLAEFLLFVIQFFLQLGFFRTRGRCNMLKLGLDVLTVDITDISPLRHFWLPISYKYPKYIAKRVVKLIVRKLIVDNRNVNDRGRATKSENIASYTFVSVFWAKFYKHIHNQTKSASTNFNWTCVIVCFYADRFRFEAKWNSFWTFNTKATVPIRLRRSWSSIKAISKRLNGYHCRVKTFVPVSCSFFPVGVCIYGCVYSCVYSCLSQKSK